MSGRLYLMYMYIHACIQTPLPVTLQPMMDRNKAADLPKLQCGFIDFVCTFVYKVRPSHINQPQEVHDSTHSAVDEEPRLMHFDRLE